jgi:glutathione-regulated potassium-efflux system ancillary protein KefF
VIVVIQGHPYPRRSRACAALTEAIRDLPGVELRFLYDLYPDFDIDAAAERAALERAGLVVWLHPLYWYTTPALLALWFERVLTKGWAYGDKGNALKGKDCLWVLTTGGDRDAFGPAGRHEHEIGAFEPVVRQTARFCGMNWLEPFVVYGGHVISDDELRAAAGKLRSRLERWTADRAEAR